MGRPHGKWLLGEHKPISEDNIKMDLKVVGWLKHELDYSTGGGRCECSKEHSAYMKCEEFLD